MILKFDQDEKENNGEEKKEETPQGTPCYDSYHLKDVVSTLGGCGELRYS